MRGKDAEFISLGHSPSLRQRWGPCVSGATAVAPAFNDKWPAVTQIKFKIHRRVARALIAWRPDHSRLAWHLLQTWAD